MQDFSFPLINTSKLKILGNKQGRLMSRLFSRLEGRGQTGTENDPPPPYDLPESPAGEPAPFEAAPLGATPAAMAPPLISADAAPFSAAPGPGQPGAPVLAAWPVKLWLLSLLSLIALSILVLALPARHSPPSPQRPDSVPGTEPPVAAPMAAPRTIAPAGRPMPAITVQPATRPAEHASRPTQPTEPGRRRAAAPGPAPAATCSDAMRAMNLCPTSSP